MRSYIKKKVKREIAEKFRRQVLVDWVKQARDSKVLLLQKFAVTLMAHQNGILSWYDHHISTKKIEGINNKIKTTKRQAYRYRDEKFFELKILSLHDKKYAFVG